MRDGAKVSDSAGPARFGESQFPPVDTKESPARMSNSGVTHRSLQPRGFPAALQLNGEGF